MYIQGKFVKQGDDLSEVFAIRRKVFVEEQNIKESLEFDEYDYKQNAQYCVVYDSIMENKGNSTIDVVTQRPIATGRIVLLEDGSFKIGRIAVLKEERGKHYGDMIVKMLISKAFQCSATEVYVSAQTKVVGFYQKLGFKKYGDIFDEAGTPHINMVLLQGEQCSKCQH